MLAEIESFVSWSINNIWIYFLLIILWLYSRYTDKKPVGDFSLKEMFIFVEFSFYILVIYLLQRYYFNEHFFLIISLPIFIIGNMALINYILNKDNVFLIETAIKNDKFFNPMENKPVLSLVTRLRILIMDREYYNSKQHIGEIYNPVQQLSNNIKFTDYYDDSTGLIYHSEFPDLQNINFFTRIAFWLNMKKELPNLIKENIKLTWLETYKTFYQVKQLAKQHKIELKGIRELLDKQPFEIFSSLDEFSDISNQLKKFENTESEITNKENEGEN